MLLDEVNSLFAIVDRFTSAWKTRKTRAVTSIPGKFVELFESHGVHRNQIPRFFGHDISLSDLADDSSLLVKLTEPVLEAACCTFAVRRDWLDGTVEEPYAVHEFYKRPEEFAQFIDGLRSGNPDVELSGYLIVREDSAQSDRAVLILKEAVSALGDTVIYRYHFCDEWAFSYWKCRAYLTACIAIAWKREVFVKGLYAGKSELSALIENKVLPGPILHRLAACGRRWYAEDLALLPEQYLGKLRPEENCFGEVAALRLWLALDDDGWMDTGLPQLSRLTFEAELAKYDTIECRGVA